MVAIIRPKMALGAVLMAVLIVGACTMTNKPAYDPVVSPFEMNIAGDLVRPTGYRSWVYVGTPVTPNDLNGGKAAFPEFHNVYIDPMSYEHYKQTGDFREGTILIKELVSVGAKKASSGLGYFEGEFIGLEATIKSSKHFADQPGNWGYFSFTNENGHGGPLKDTASVFPAASCNSCHAANADDDFVFTQYYPVLRAVKGEKINPEDRRERPKTLGKATSSESNESVSSQSQRDSKWTATRPTPKQIDGTDVPLVQDDLFKYLRTFQYKEWKTKEPAVHPSRGPHVKYGKPVRVFFNDTLAASMELGQSEHPEGSAAIKEMYEDDGSLIGWAVEVKTQKASDDGDGWFWYEVTSTTDGSDPVAIGNGIAGCVGCHASGEDYVVSDQP